MNKQALPAFHQHFYVPSASQGMLPALSPFSVLNSTLSVVEWFRKAISSVSRRL